MCYYILFWHVSRASSPLLKSLESLSSYQIFWRVATYMSLVNNGITRIWISDFSFLWIGFEYTVKELLYFAFGIQYLNSINKINFTLHKAWILEYSKCHDDSVMRIVLHISQTQTQNYLWNVDNMDARACIWAEYFFCLRNADKYFIGKGGLCHTPPVLIWNDFNKIHIVIIATYI